MQMTRWIVTIIIVCLIWSGTQAQEIKRVLTGSNYDSIVVNKGEVVEIANDHVNVSLLKMDKGSTLRFRQPTVFTVESAFIGTGCAFDASAEKLMEPKQDLSFGTDGVAGNHGYDLDIQIAFFQLGQLLIDTQGGRGGNGTQGAIGKSGLDGTIGDNDGENGQDGGRGGDGGDAGNLSLRYKCIGFVAAINDRRRKQNVINLQFDGGRGGRGGNGGLGGLGGRPRGIGTSDPNGKNTTSFVGNAGKNGLPGKPGISGRDGKRGELRVTKME